MGKGFIQNRAICTLFGQKLGKMSSEWVISLSFRPPFVKIRRYVPNMKAYLVDLSSLSGPVVSNDTISIDSIVHNDTARMRYEAIYSYYLNTPNTKIYGTEA